MDNNNYNNEKTAHESGFFVVVILEFSSSELLFFPETWEGDGPSTRNFSVEKYPCLGKDKGERLLPRQMSRYSPI